MGWSFILIEGLSMWLRAFKKYYLNIVSGRGGAVREITMIMPVWNPFFSTLKNIGSEVVVQKL
jgi:hypothetical protein